MLRPERIASGSTRTAVATATQSAHDEHRPLASSRRRCTTSATSASVTAQNSAPNTSVGSVGNHSVIPTAVDRSVDSMTKR